MNTSSDVDCLNVSVSCTMTSCRKQGKALKVRISTSNIFAAKISKCSTSKFVSANHILQNFLSAANVPRWKWVFSL